MNNKYLVSIIIPVFNEKPFLVEALNSVLNQTYHNIEIIIIDDGSTDGFAEICDYYSKTDKRVKVIHQDNKGLSSARNSGLDIMSGDAVAFLDADDAYDPDFIRVMLETMISENVDIVVCKYTVHYTTNNMKNIDMHRTHPEIKHGMYDRDSALRTLANGSLNQSVWNKIYVRDLWRNTRFTDGLLFEDVDITYRLIEASQSIFVVNHNLYLQRKHEGTITNSYSRKSINDWFIACEHFESYIKDNIPQIFSLEHLNNSRQFKIKSLVYFYCQFSISLIKEERDYAKVIRQKTIEIAKTTNLSINNIFVLLSFYLLYFCPGLLKTIFPYYCCICQYVQNLVALDKKK